MTCLNFLKILLIDSKDIIRIEWVIHVRASAMNIQLKSPDEGWLSGFISLEATNNDDIELVHHKKPDFVFPFWCYH